MNYKRLTLILIAVCVTFTASAKTITVSKADGNGWWPAPAAGDGSFSGAILEAKASVGADKIVFNLPGGTVINTAGKNPLIIDASDVEFDGSTEGANIKFGVSLSLTGSKITLKNIDIHSTGSFYGVAVSESRNTIRNCYISGSKSYGVQILSDSNQVVNNKISENGVAGVMVDNSKHNIIGTAGEGNNFVNNTIGVLIGKTALYNQVRGNSFSCNGLGIKIVESGNNGFGGKGQDKIITTNSDESGPSFVTGTAPASSVVDIYRRDIECANSCNVSDTNAQGSFIGTTYANELGLWEFDVSMIAELNYTNVLAVATDTSSGNTSEFSVCKGGSVSVKKNKLETHLVYPNPSTGVYNIIGKAANWKLYSSQLKEISRGFGTVVNVSHCAEGVYFLSVDGLVQKLIKQE